MNTELPSLTLSLSVWHVDASLFLLGASMEPNPTKGPKPGFFKLSRTSSIESTESIPCENRLRRGIDSRAREGGGRRS